MPWSLLTNNEGEAIFRDKGYATQNNFRIALIVALVLHVLIAILIPPVDGLRILSHQQNVGINVFLNIKEKIKPLDKNLNQPLPLPNTDQPLFDPSLGSASEKRGDDEILSEQTPESESSSSDTVDTDSEGEQKAASAQNVVSFDSAAIKLFAQKEAVRVAEQNPKELARFKRSFNSRRNYQRRTRAQSYKNQYGDYYLKTRSSVGDICFVKKPDLNPTAENTNTVYFFECGKKPLKLDLNKD